MQKKLNLGTPFIVKNVKSVFGKDNKMQPSTYKQKPEEKITNAWDGWHHKYIAVYALQKAAIEVELFLSHQRHTNAYVSEM